MRRTLLYSAGAAKYIADEHATQGFKLHEHQ